MKRMILAVFIFIFSTNSFSENEPVILEKELSDLAWEKSANIIQKIIQHPFNKYLMQGNLDHTKFAYYLEQDDIYLQDYARCLAIISTRIELPYAKVFLKYAEETLRIEQNQLHKYFKDALHFQQTGQITPANLSYTSYLLRTCSIEPVEVAVAAILPCFWIYREVGLSIAKGSPPNNRYRRWIETYSNKEFNDEVDEVIAIFNHMANNTTNATRQKMLTAFYTSSLLEWYFWDDAYNQRVFDKI